MEVFDCQKLLAGVPSGIFTFGGLPHPFRPSLKRHPIDVCSDTRVSWCGCNYCFRGRSRGTPSVWGELNAEELATAANTYTHAHARARHRP